MDSRLVWTRDKCTADVLELNRLHTTFSTANGSPCAAHALPQHSGGSGGLEKTTAERALQIGSPDSAWPQINPLRSSEPRDTSRLIRVLRKLCAPAPGSRVHIVVLGNSGTQGQGCNSPRGHYKRGPPMLCAWPYRFLEYLRAAYPSATITLTNTARTGMRAADYVRDFPQLRSGAKPVHSWVNPATEQAAGWGATDDAFQSSRLEDADLVIADFGWSDWRQFDGTWEAERLDVPQELALQMMNEELIVRLLTFLPHAALLYLETHVGCRPTRSASGPPRGHTPTAAAACILGGTQDAHAPVLQHYAVPQVSLRDAVDWHRKPGLSIDHPLSFDSEAWSRTRIGTATGAHPNWEGHQLLADLLASFWQRIAASVCPSTSEPLNRLGLRAEGVESVALSAHPRPAPLPPRMFERISRLGCGRHVLSRHDAMHDAAGFQGALHAQAAWQCDTKSRRPGCVGERLSGNLSLAVKCGPQAQLIVTYVKSHATFGRARLVLVHRATGLEVAHSLNARWEDRFSLPFSSQISCQPPGEHVMHLSVESEQFKLVAVQSC